MEFTPEQKAYIDNLLEESKKGLFTEDELNRRVTSEVDRRVESGIQKGLETHKAKWEKEFIEKAKLSAEELAQKELDEKMREISSKELDIKKRTNTLDAKDMLSGAGIPKAHYEKFIPLLVSDDAEVTTVNVTSFIETFNETKTTLEQEIKQQYVQVPPPSNGSGDQPITKKEFDEMSYMEKIKLKESNPEVYKSFMK